VLEGALKPLADCEIIEPDVPLPDGNIARYPFTMGEIRAARAALSPSPLVEGGNTGRYCSWCSKPLLPGEPTGWSDGEEMHAKCAVEDMDNATFDRDMGFD
jgi:hypothetical protein